MKTWRWCDLHALRKSSWYWGKFPWLQMSLNHAYVLIRCVEHSMSQDFGLWGHWGIHVCLCSEDELDCVASLCQKFTFFLKTESTMKPYYRKTLHSYCVCAYSTPPEVFFHRCKWELWKIILIALCPMHVMSPKSKSPSSERKWRKDMLVHACNPWIQEVAARRWWVWCYPWLKRNIL